MRVQIPSPRGSPFVSPRSWHSRSPYTSWSSDHSDEAVTIPILQHSRIPVATPPSLSPSEWPYHEHSWDLNSPSVSPQVSPFRVPRGRPPSRNNHMSLQSPLSNHMATFLKPFPPCSRDNTGSEPSATTQRQMQTVKIEPPQSHVVKSEYETHYSGHSSHWSVEKQLAWNDRFVRQSYYPAETNNQSWPADYSQKKSQDGYHQFKSITAHNLLDVKQENHVWSQAESLHKTSESMSAKLWPESGVKPFTSIKEVKVRQSTSLNAPCAHQVCRIRK